MIRSRIDSPPILSSGLGTLSVSGRRRSPRPPAMTTATGAGGAAPGNSVMSRTPARRLPSTTGTALSRYALRTASTSASFVPFATVTGRVVMTSATGVSRDVPLSATRRMAASVTVPTSADARPVTHASRVPAPCIAASVSASDAPGATVSGVAGLARFFGIGAQGRCARGTRCALVLLDSATCRPVASFWRSSPGLPSPAF